MFEELAQYVTDIRLPRFYRVRQHFDETALPKEDVPKILTEKLRAAGAAERIRPGDSVCIPCGSRGIDNLVPVLRTIADFCRAQGAFPFIIPAMGSHGGATAEGQEAIVRSYGVTEESTGCPIRATMETVVIGHTEDGRPVHLDKYAAQADKIIVVNRIKPHTSFRGPYESGLMKMMAIGLGKQKGAEACHSAGYKYMAKNIPAFGKVYLSNAPVVLGVGLLENAFDKTAKIAVLRSEEIEEGEPKLLKEAFRLMPQLYFDSCDVLVVDEIGKNISGGGMDPNISGAFATVYASGGIDAQLRCILSISEASHGSAYGMGAADVISRKFYEAIDFSKTYPNSITSKALSFSRMPLVMPDDRSAIALCVKSCTDVDPASPRIIRIKNTLSLGEIQISEAMLPEAEAHPNLSVVGGPEELVFDENGNL